jgi:hypothetical protein
MTLLKAEIKSKLYFNKFQYKAVCNIQGAAYTYYTPNLATFVARMEKLKDAKFNNRYGVRTIDDSWKVYWEEVNVDQISQFLNWRNTIDKDKCMIRIQGDMVSFFSNNLNLLETLKSIDNNLRFFESKVLAPNTIYFKKQPKFKFRTFFKGKRCPEEFLPNILEFSERYVDLNLSQGLKRLANDRKNTISKFLYLHSSYFVEYDDESMITIMHMLFPGMVGKTYKLDKRP